MEHSYIINSLKKNAPVFKDLLSEISKEEYLWRPVPEKWCLLEIVCHLYDEEQYDFRARTKHVLDNNKNDPPKIDPAGWVKSRSYIEQNYNEVLEKFLDERKKSVEWLNALKDPNWKNEYIHPTYGAMPAEFFLANWLAHDYLHIRQITALKYKYLFHKTQTDLGYAGDW